MFSPALRNRQRVLAAAKGKVETKATRKAPGQVKSDTPAGQEYAALRAVLHDNLRSLADTASHEARQPKKAEYAKAFVPWIEGVLAADEPVQDEILLTNMIWAIDYRDFRYALTLGAFALRHGLAMPDQYNRSVACFLAEDIAELAIKDPEAVDHDVLMAVDLLTGNADMPDPAKAKLFKALGRSWAKRAENFEPSGDNAPAGGAKAYAQQALGKLNRALALDEKAGVKTDIKAVEKFLKQLDEGTN